VDLSLYFEDHTKIESHIDKRVAMNSETAKA